MRRSLISLAAGAATIFALVAGGTANAAPARPDAAKPKAGTLAFSDAQPVLSVSTLTMDLPLEAPAICAGKPVSGSRTFSQAIAEAKAIEDKAGKAAVRKVDSSRDTSPPIAEVDATRALTNANPVGALAALMAAYGKNPKNATVLRDLGSMLAQLDQPLDALALFGQADKVGGAVQHPMGISETATELNDRGYALLELNRWAAAGTELAKAVADAALLSEAKLNLGTALLCQGKVGQAAKMIFAGSRRNTFKKLDSDVDETIVPAAEIIDVSHGHSGTWPSIKYPSNMDDVDKDGNTFSKDESDEFLTAVDESKKVADLLASVTLPPISQRRIDDLESLAGDDVAGGWAGKQQAAAAAETAVNNFIDHTFAGGGTAEAELNSIMAGGGSPCAAQRPQMRAWLSSQTGQFHGLIEAWDSALRSEWMTESRWASAVDANIATPAINKAFTYGLDEGKQAYLQELNVAAETWSSDTVGDDDMFGDCQDVLGPDQSDPAGSLDRIDLCTQKLARVNWSLSFGGIFRIKVNCERVEISGSEPGLVGVFGKLTIKSTGEVTAMVGVKAGFDLGPVTAGVQAGVYVSANSTQFTDVGITANAKAETTGPTIDPLNLTGPSATATVSFVNGVSTSASF
jgi:tetratricopeptide (TPR) repeat protein